MTMHGKDYLGRLDAAFPGILQDAWKDYFLLHPHRQAADFDRHLAGDDGCETGEDTPHPIHALGVFLGAHLTPEVIRKARAVRGITDKPVLRQPEPAPLKAVAEPAPPPQPELPLVVPGISKADFGALIGGIMRDVVGKEVGALREELRRSTGHLAARLEQLENAAGEAA